MSTGRSFTDYVKSKCYNGLFDAAKEYTEQHWPLLNLYFKRIKQPDAPDFEDATIQRVYVNDLPGMKVAFDVGMELELVFHECDHHLDESEVHYPWIRISCEGDLTCGLDDWVITAIQPAFERKAMPPNSLSDSLVPFIGYDNLDAAAESFLKDYYPEALKITKYGEPPVYVDPMILADRLKLDIRTQRIKKDISVFGQIFFADCETEVYDPINDAQMAAHIDAGTILVDPEIFLLRNLGSVNNTIIHECVHWVKHNKVFVLEKLYNENASYISCEVIGGAKADIAKTSTEQMERQANQLTPRIQMPAAPFKAKANEYIGKFMREAGTSHAVDVMENVITQLQMDFGVSKQAAKIRLVELGFEDAIGTFTYLDGHYVKPHGFKRGSIRVNQTFSISAVDAAIQSMVNPALNSLTKGGSYQFVDNHFVINLPQYILYDENGEASLTDYARTHMDECALVFDMSISNDIAPQYHTECFLNREKSFYKVDFTYSGYCQFASDEAKAAAIKKEQDDVLALRKRMTDDPNQCFDEVLDWCDMTATAVTDKIGKNSKLITRLRQGEGTTVKTMVQLCLAMHLPPEISEKLMDVCGCKLTFSDEHGWYRFVLTYKYKENLYSINSFLRQQGFPLFDDTENVDLFGF